MAGSWQARAWDGPEAQQNFQPGPSPWCRFSGGGSERILSRSTHRQPGLPPLRRPGCRKRGDGPEPDDLEALFSTPSSVRHTAMIAERMLRYYYGPFLDTSVAHYDPRIDILYRVFERHLRGRLRVCTLAKHTD